MQTLLSIIYAVATVIASPFAGPAVSPQPAQLTPQMTQAIDAYLHESAMHLGAAPSPIAGQTYNLAGAGISSTASSVTLQSLTITQTGQKIMTADLRQGANDLFYVTIEPGSRLRQEIIGCSTVTQNSNGTATLGGCSRGMSPIYPYTASTTLAFVHGGGVQAIFSDAPQLFNDIITYINGAVVSGAVDASLTAKGIVEKASGAEAAAHAGVGSGNTSAPLALTSDIASSTWPGGVNSVVVTKSSGYIDNSLIATSSAKDSVNPLFKNVTLEGTTTVATTTSYFTNGIPLMSIGKNYIVVTSTGTSTITIPSGVNRALVTICAGGGTSPGQASGVVGATGGAGGCAIKSVDLTGTTSVTSYVGAAAQWTTFGVNGFYFYCNKGVSASGGGGQDGGAGGTCVGGDINIPGGRGAPSLAVSGLTSGANQQAGASFLGGDGAYGSGTSQGVIIFNY